MEGHVVLTGNCHLLLKVEGGGEFSCISPFLVFLCMLCARLSSFMIPVSMLYTYYISPVAFYYVAFNIPVMCVPYIFLLALRYSVAIYEL